jgi:O-antigen/teichoic acid export membrane protein
MKRSTKLISFLIKFFTKSKPFIFQIITKFLALGVGLVPQRYINSGQILQSDRSNLEIIFSLNAIILSLIDFAVSQIIYKAYTNERNDKKLSSLWSTFFLLRAVMYFVGLIIIIIITNIAAYGWNTIPLYLFIAVYTSQYLLIVDGGYKAVSDTRGTSLRFTSTDLIMKFFIALTLLIAPFVWGNIYDLYIYLTVNIVANILILFVDYWTQKEFIYWGKIDLKIISKSFKTMAVITFSAVLSSIYTKAGIFLINDSGLRISYGVANKTYDLMIIVPSLIVPILASQFKHNFSNRPPEYTKKMIFRKYFLAMILLGILTTVMSILASYPILILTNGIRYENSFLYSTLISLNFLLFPLLIFIGNLTLFFGLNKLMLINVILNFFFAILTYYLMSQYFGILGVIYTAILINIFDLIIKLFLIYKNRDTFI